MSKIVDLIKMLKEINIVSKDIASAKQGLPGIHSKVNVSKIAHQFKTLMEPLQLPNVLVKITIFLTSQPKNA